MGPEGVSLSFQRVKSYTQISDYGGVGTPTPHGAQVSIVLEIWNVFGPYVIKIWLSGIKDPFLKIRFSFNIISHCTLLILFHILGQI